MIKKWDKTLKGRLERANKNCNFKLMVRWPSFMLQNGKWQSWHQGFTSKDKVEALYKNFSRYSTTLRYDFAIFIESTETYSGSSTLKPPEFYSIISLVHDKHRTAKKQLTL